MFPQVRNVLQKQNLVSDGNVVEQHQMLVQLSHVADMRRHRQAKFSCQQAHGEKFADSAQAGAVGLNKTQGAGLHEVLKQNAIGNVFPGRNLHGGDFAGQYHVRVNVVGMSWLFQPQGLEFPQLAAHANGARQGSSAGWRRT